MIKFSKLHGIAAIAVVLTAGALAFPAAAADDDQAALIAEGELIFQETAGDVGCAYCHGPEATGDPDAGGPSLRGATMAQLDSALDGAVPVMEFIEISDHDRKAVHAYLVALARGPEATLGEDAAAGKEIFEKTAGGVGCASCHGANGEGDIGPDIRGRDSVAILEQLRVNDAMDFIKLTDIEVDQVAAYLRVLHDSAEH